MYMYIYSNELLTSVLKETIQRSRRKNNQRVTINATHWKRELMYSILSSKAFLCEQ